MTTARQKVLNYLAKNRTASAREIARSLKMSAATVRHHLRLLVSDGRLELESVRSRAVKGRPEKVYSLPRSALGDNLSALSDALLAEAGALGGDEASQMKALAGHLAGESNFGSQPVVKRLNLIVEKLDRMNYHARWEAGAEGPRVHFGHCPYAAIIARHPELCEMDTNLVSLLAARPVLRESKPETQTSGVCPYVFLVR